ncbi:MAG: bifunctional diaminohydroxyphosphoribosylaminopyrimidine deaminase/5-amino-6-(5-phosphoribosylamino)uracil reductase RibD [Desulfobacteraceae bacterium]|nr:bifunctional diaminohydroxyphosphoribosylaminopyrimidine deaminase/5-amino-6-(5-phosphoribosylamino)uracil reductase RibD [Desulfobacteraceae bacterium]
MTDQEYMDLAIALAEKGRGYTSPNPIVGAVVVKDGAIVGQGWHHGPGLPHAEVEAINDAGDLARGSDIYVTLEPCNHTGRTPPCTRKILDAGIRRVFVGTEDPNPFVAGGGIRFLREQGVEVQVGVSRTRAEVLIEDFIWYVKNDKHPFVVLKCASTLDGRLATSTGDSKWITNELSRGRVHELRHWVDAILVGAGTVKADNPSLTTRIEGVDTRDPIRVILDARLSIDPDARVVTRESDAKTIIATSESADPERRALFQKRGVQLLILPEKDGMIDFDSLMARLGELGIMSVLIEGGGRVIHSALSAGIVNKAYLFMAPKLLGGDDGVSMCRGKGPVLMKDAVQLSRVAVESFDDDILVTGYLKNS